MPGFGDDWRDRYQLTNIFNHTYLPTVSLTPASALGTPVTTRYLLTCRSVAVDDEAHSHPDNYQLLVRFLVSIEEVDNS